MLPRPAHVALCCVCAAVPQAPKLGDSGECAICKFLVGQVKTMVVDPATQARMNETARAVCGALPADIAGVCNSLWDTYGGWVGGWYTVQQAAGWRFRAMPCAPAHKALHKPGHHHRHATSMTAPTLVLLLRPHCAFPAEPLILTFLDRASPDDLCALAGLCMNSLVARTAELRFMTIAAPMPALAPALSAVGQARMVAQGAAVGLPLGDSCDTCRMAVIQAHALIANPSVQVCVAPE